MKISLFLTTTAATQSSNRSNALPQPPITVPQRKCLQWGSTLCGGQACINLRVSVDSKHSKLLSNDVSIRPYTPAYVSIQAVDSKHSKLQGFREEIGNEEIDRGNARCFLPEVAIMNSSKIEIILHAQFSNHARVRRDRNAVIDGLPKCLVCAVNVEPVRCWSSCGAAQGVDRFRALSSSGAGI